tara:strand:+ start:400 stop:1194 length:795 start_codon:yes stop_codon:yes gene_type:complete
MIDFHNHVLPNVDDGPKTIEESMQMIRHANEQGITDIVQTVHFQHPKMDGKNVDFNYLNNKIKELQSEIVKENLNIKLHLSAEVFYIPNLVEISENPLVTCRNKKYMLIEFTTNIFPTGYEEEFYKLQTHGITPIVAHPERYRFIQNDLSILELWINRGYKIQIDAGSIIGQFGNHIKNISYEMINKGYIHLIGSDAHNDNKRNFCINEAYEFLDKKQSSNLVDFLKQNAMNYLNGKDIITVNNIKKNKASSFMTKIFNFIKIK